MVGDTAKRELSGQFPNEVIRASAGTGKTFALSNRYLKLLASGAECQTILATTFTKKGAGEILDRIISRLSDAALSEAAAELLSSQLEFALPQKRAAKILHDLLSNLHRLEISTLDSFFNRVAKAFALELGLPPSWEIVDEKQAQQLSDKAIQAVLREDSVLSLIHMLAKGDASRRVASLVKDTVNQIYEVYRESGDDPWNKVPKLGSPISDADLDELFEGIESFEFTNKSTAKQWLKWVEILKSHDWSGLMADCTAFVRAIEGNFKYNRKELPDSVKRLFQAIIPHVAHYFSDRLIRQNRSTRELLSGFGEILERRKNETGTLRFDDVTCRLADFVSLWQTDRFAFRLDHQIQHLLLDEFQDTSLTQWQVIRPFADAITGEPDELKSFFCVGDMKQAIFGWRGGVAEIFDLVDETLDNLDSTRSLTASYRSSTNVIDFVNKVFLNAGNYDCKEDIYNRAVYQWADGFQKHTTERKDLAGYVSIEMADETKSSRAKSYDDARDRARNTNVLKDTVRRVVHLDQTLPQHHTIGVLVRTNREARDLIGELQRAGVYASEEGGTAITDSAAVEIVLSALTLADHPGDSAARFHVSHSPLAMRFGLQPETCETQKSNQKQARSAAADLRRQLIENGYGPTIESLARMLIDDCTERELARLQHLVRIAYENPTDIDQWDLRPIRFVEYVRDEVKVSDESAARIRVMTIHKSKGLEFDVVVLPMPTQTHGWAGMTPSVVVGRSGPTEPIDVATRYVSKNVRKLFPDEFVAVFENEAERQVRETMCVFYVALTRAVHAMHVIVSYGAKVEHKSPAGVLISSVCPDAKRAAGLLYEEGDVQWYLRTQNEQVQEASPFEEFYVPDVLELRSGYIPTETRSGRGLPHSRPSGLETGRRFRLGELFETKSRSDSKTRGTLIHGCFECVRWLDEGVPGKQELESHLRKVDPTQEDFDEVIASFFEMLETPQLKFLLSRGTYSESYLMDFAEPGAIAIEANRLELHNERRFAVTVDGKLVNGVVDRLVLVYQGDQIVAADIIDFKTDQVERDTLHHRIEDHRPQLLAYRDAVATFTNLPLDKISTRLVFVSTGQIINLGIAETSVGGKPGSAQPRRSKSTKTKQATRGKASTRRIPKPKSDPSRDTGTGKKQGRLFD